MSANTASSGGLDGAFRTEVGAALEQLLGSPEFRQSEQSKRLLRHLVEVSLDGSQDQLKERAIGASVFGLESGYDTAENPIVRVRVNELRKRLAKYYQEAGAVRVRFEIPARGYRVEVLPAVIVAPAEEPSPRRRLVPVALALGLAVAAVAGVAFAGWWQWNQRKLDVLHRFWAPALESRSSILICAGHPVVYRLSREAQERIHGGTIDHYQGQTLDLSVRPDAVLRGRDIVSMPDQYIGLGSAEAVARVNGFLQKQEKATEIRFGNDLTFSELRKSPAVLIGAFQNRWTVEFMKGMRFVFDAGTSGAPAVVDTSSGRRFTLPTLQPNGQTREDYVLVSRILRGASGEFVIAAGGITQYGGHTVGEVLSDSGLLGTMLRGASKSWESRNLQLLMKVQVIGKTAGPPEVVALHEW
ncbi:MAG: hypothetical protein SGI92_19050 [Bryobacteraceae bacterium]|nr:hypothetical protein [Bryobacteraceae bacterium]